jgi:probable addiction module antidote protein
MLKTTRFDIVDYLKTEKDMRRYLEGVFDENDPEFIPVALGDLARARKRMAAAAEAAGIARPNMYRALSRKGRPSFATVARAINALGYRLSVVPLEAHS